jgi:hypothetical protein
MDERMAIEEIEMSNMDILDMRGDDLEDLYEDIKNSE